MEEGFWEVDLEMREKWFKFKISIKVGEPENVWWDLKRLMENFINLVSKTGELVRLFHSIEKFLSYHFHDLPS